MCLSARRDTHTNIAMAMDITYRRFTLIHIQAIILGIIFKVCTDCFIFCAGDDNLASTALFSFLYVLLVCFVYYVYVKCCSVKYISAGPSIPTFRHDVTISRDLVT